LLKRWDEEKAVPVKRCRFLCKKSKPSSENVIAITYLDFKVDPDD
jgi:hypothetical protein